MTTRILIADDHEIVREGLRRILAADPTFVVAGEARDGNEVMAAVRNIPRERRVEAAYARADEISDEDVAINQAIGRNGLKLIEDIARRKKSGAPAGRAGDPRLAQRRQSPEFRWPAWNNKSAP